MNSTNIKGSRLDNLYEFFDNTNYTADEYVPTVEEMKVIANNLDEYVEFLFWIEETGIETEDNEEIRHLISIILKKYVDISDD